MRGVLSILSLTFLMLNTVLAQITAINRQSLVQRHNITNTRIDSLESLSLGNGKFAFTADVTGLQTFPERYAKGVSLGTQSEWGWNSFPNTENYTFDETLKPYDFNNDGRKALYSVQIKEPERNKKAVEYFP